VSRRRGGVDLGDRLEALGAAVAVADGRLDPAVVDAGRDLLRRAEERLGRAPERTVVALAGATGSGKSSLFNALTGSDLATVGVRRPTTGEAQAAVWGDGDAGAVLDWLEVRRRHAISGDGAGPLDGLVLLDLPDHDSTVEAHRLVVDRLVARVDLLVWVLDPQKYADAAVHERYLRPLAGHAGVVLVVLNHADRLGESEAAACLADLRRLLAEDGLADVPVLPTSARTGLGVDRLRAELAERARRRRAAVERLGADVDGVVGALGGACADGRGPGRLSSGRVGALVDALATAAGVDAVAGAVDRSHRRQATAATGWPFTRWVARLRPDPLRRLRAPAVGTAGEPAAALSSAGVGLATRDLAADLAGGLPDPWPALVRRAAERAEPGLAVALEDAVASAAPPSGGPRPRWWSVAAVAQRVLALAALAGLVWLVALFALEWLRLPDPPLPRLGELPVPTVLLVGGAVAGLLLAWVARRLAAVGGRRRARRARARLAEAVAAVAERHVLDPVRAELAAHDELCEAVRRAARR
jgi:hypothetical protein